ncbi:MAG TPA: RND transporter [Pirellulales bacterium]|nr:RND transporter [Pirellulales bacterium]
MTMLRKLGAVVGLLFVASAIGCGAAVSTATVAADHAEAKAKAGHVHTHDSWWCDEHGVPEEMCGQCSAKVAADCQKKGDWCAQHDRPDSQCFLCHPELEARFAARYEAKYGKKPPQPEG